ncbi:hypothetical protein A2310_00525 [candidate division WOR-1 bacterium RIFOXYB2_FULL_37_13]|uniref:Ion-translocating oxidoreductase complex subunit G n=1 Tax=candidate division WOR-1 bacterium RIFOXYB2_FULL_37_13 TaxID=1802579 RepID=A0A1F4SRA9_UNCSA|nr:MAG: hypothetical protein A2310_00525 [candidate division WOR-1 bacterium RIFOXYB2_FULL_37_13]
MGKILKLGFVLMVFCVISAGALAYVYLFTQPKIELNGKRAFESSLTEVLPNALVFNIVKIGSKEVYQGLSGKDIIGTVFFASPRGYSSNINMLVGIDSNAKISGIKIVSQNETPGLGTNVAKRSFLDQFLGKTANDQIEAKKDIDAITGATISSRAVCRGVREALNDFEKNKKVKQ